MRKITILKCFLGLLTVSGTLVELSAAEKPNIVYILADDLGYGEVQALNPERNKIPTPHMDSLATKGMVFTDAHSTSSVCTPTRYGILTGRYNWRTRLQRSVLYGFDRPLIAKDRLTVAGFLKQQGYTTACIGKWHLGLNLPTKNGQPAHKKTNTDLDWKAPVKGGPVEHGFDYFHGISASLDMPPYIYIENDRFVGEATATKDFHINRRGPAHPDLEAVDILPEIENQSVKFIQQQQGDKPFFMYVALTSPHTPIVASKEWQGKSELGNYGDFVMHTDSVVGKIIAAVDASKFADNTIIILTSDNGCSARPAKAKELEAQGHYPSGQLRGYKSDLWDGGHRVPFIVRWPARVKAGTTSNQLVCQTDLMATCAELTQAKLPDTAGEDSVSFLPALDGKPIISTRAGVVHHSIGGKFAYRMGKWKLLMTRGSGGWTKAKKSETSPIQLYDMEADLGEQNNLEQQHPEIVQRLLAQLQSDIKRGRSTAGPDLANDVPVKFKEPKPKKDPK